MSDISFLLLYVENVAASEAFYAANAGAQGGRILADLRDDPRRARRHARALAARRRRARARGVEGRGAAAGEIAFALESDAAVDAAFAEWRARGVEIAQPPTRLDFGYAFLGLDPDGHRLRVFAPGQGGAPS